MSSSWAKRALRAGARGQEPGVGGFRFALLLCLCGSSIFAQDQHVTWTATAEPAKVAPGSKFLLKIDGKIEEGWHVYSMSTAGARPTKFTVTGAVVDAVRPLQPKAIVAFDPNFSAKTESYEKDVTFLLEVAVKKDAPAGEAQLAIAGTYQVCNPKSCVPSKWAGAATVTIDPAASASAPVIPAGYSEPQAPPPPGTTVAGDQDLGAFLLTAFGFG